MKKIFLKNLVAFPIGFLLTLVISYFFALNSQKAVTSFAEEAFHKNLDTVMDSLHHVYFSDDQLIEAIESEEHEFTQELFGHLKDEYKYIHEITLTDKQREIDEFTIEVVDNQIIVYTEIMNSTNTYSSDIYVAKLVILPSVLLDTIAIDDEIEFSFEYIDQRIILIPTSSILYPWHYFVSLLSGFLLQIIVSLFYRLSIVKYYQIDGLKTITMILSARDPYTATHSENVAHLSNSIGVKLGLTKKELSVLYSAAILHDIGKIGVSDIILNKPDKLTVSERELIEKHPKLSYDIVSEFPGLEKIALIVNQHHEKLDGSGYPNGLVKHEINFLSQILTVVDIYDALTSKRPYRSAFSEEDAIKIMRETSINQDIVDIIEEINKNKL